MTQTFRSPRDPRTLFNFLADFGCVFLQSQAVAVGGSDVAIAHTMGKIPSIVWVVHQRGGKVENSSTASTLTNVYLVNRGTTAATVDILLFPPMT